MRSTLSLAVLLVAMAIALLLASRQTRRDLDAVRSVSFAARENVPAEAFDAAEARRFGERLRTLAETPEIPVDELRRSAERAAGWAAALTPGTPDYHLVVNLRGAADELVDATPSLTDPHRAAARRLLEAADARPGVPGGGPPGAIGGVRDQLQNIQQSQREKLQEVEHEPR